MNPVKRATKTERRWTAWFAAVSVWALVGLVGVHSYALELGAAHHDMFCDAHQPQPRSSPVSRLLRG